MGQLEVALLDGAQHAQLSEPAHPSLAHDLEKKPAAKTDTTAALMKKEIRSERNDSIALYLQASRT